MPDGWGGKKITAADRKASRFRNRACSNEALADGHTMLALIHERIDGPAAALEDAKEAAKLADLGGEPGSATAHAESRSSQEMPSWAIRIETLTFCLHVIEYACRC